MKIGIIVYSQTGNTYSVAQKLETRLAAAGHSVTLERITIIGEASPGTPVQFQTRPDVGPYDALVFGAPVQAFSLVTVMRSYLGQIASLQGKQVACFVTKQLPFYWT
ncbi:MAG: flavodoxin family protein, partial [Anaerolineae bacterium]|nr:flavodoxin family protein [Anaerolineae bacterium]